MSDSSDLSDFSDCSNFSDSSELSDCSYLSDFIASFWGDWNDSRDLSALRDSKFSNNSIVQEPRKTLL